MLDKDRNEKDIYLRAYSINNKEGKVVGLVGMHTDITDRKKVDEKLRKSERQLLDSQRVARLGSWDLTLCLNAAADKKNIQISGDTQNRIFSMALAHEKLYKARDLSRINLNDYIRDLVTSLLDSYQISKGNISLVLDIDNISVSIDTITPCGLVINELMTNTLKYAFPDNRAGKISISAHLNTDGIIELRFSDDGIGIPDGVDLGKPESLGFKIVHTLIETQLKGKMVVESVQGTGFAIRFKEIDKRNRI